MITQLALQNIRVFDDDFWEFDLAPLTVLCGANSCGKSTLLKTLQMLRQTMDYRESLGSDDGELRFVGSYVDMGGYTSLVSHREAGRTMGVRIGVESRVSRSGLEDLRRIMGLDGASTGESATTSKARVTYILLAEFLFRPATSTREADEDEDRDVARPTQNRPGDELRGQMESATFDLMVRGRPVAHWFVKRAPAGDDYELYVPLPLFRDYRRQLHIKAAVPKQRTRRKEKYAVVPVQMIGLIPVRMSIPLRVSGEGPGSQPSGKSSVTVPLPGHLSGPCHALLRAVDTVHYLGPLRSAARRYYVLDANRAVMDSAGEYMPYVLRDSLDRSVVHVAPEGGRKKKVSLGEALNDWLRYLRAGDQSVAPEKSELRVLPTKHVFVELAIRSALGEEQHALADSGVGYSQVLPILVQCLLAVPGSTTTIEQPELHLNPALQVRLATFFARMAECGKQVILETHSEHIVNAIRVLAAEDATGKLARSSRIYFIDTSGSEMGVCDMSITPDGKVSDWPDSFFGEALTLTGRLLRAQRQRREAKASM